jgi:hypothetical protein
MIGLLYESTRCPDGVELVAEGLKKKWFRYRSDRRVPIRLELTNLENPVVIAFVNAKSDDDLAQFFSRFGFHHQYHQLDGQPEDKSFAAFMGNTAWALTFQQSCFHGLRATRDFADEPDREDREKAMAAITDLFEDPMGGFFPSLTFGDDGLPRMLLRASTLADFMRMEIAQVVLHGAKVTACDHCASAFLTGPLTWRRSHAVYCSDRCRVAAMLVRNARPKKQSVAKKAKR